MRYIGESISEAIDWTQDTLRSTRPDAERVLFEMISAKKVRETEDGFILLEDEDDEIHRRHRNRTVKPRFRFHHARKAIHERNQQHRHAQKHKIHTRIHVPQQNDAADDMMSMEDEEG